MAMALSDDIIINTTARVLAVLGLRILPILSLSMTLSMSPRSLADTSSVAEHYPLLHGSLKLLDTCWEPADFEFRDERDRILPLREPDFEPPNGVEAVSANAPVAAGGEGPLGTIRGVELGQQERSIALTFNLIERSGEVSGYDSLLIEALRKHNVSATFFATGKWMRSHPQRIQQLMADPRFEIGSLGWNHGNLAVLKGQAIVDQLIWPEAQYRNARDALTKTDCSRKVGDDEMAMIAPTMSLFRFPYGRCNQESLEAVAQYGLRPVQWSLVMDDIADDVNKRTIVDRVIDNLHPGAILVGHADGRAHFGAQALGELIPRLLSEGYFFVTVSQLLVQGQPRIAPTCYEHSPGDNLEYDDKFGDGTL